MNFICLVNIPFFFFFNIFQSFDIWPVLVRVDYSPCRVDLAALRGGKYVELVNLVPWKVNYLHFSCFANFGFYFSSSLIQK